MSEEYMRYLDNTQNVEKRFPVDRRKLEELIKGIHFWEFLLRLMVITCVQETRSFVFYLCCLSLVCLR